MSSTHTTRRWWRAGIAGAAAGATLLTTAALPAVAAVSTVTVPGGLKVARSTDMNRLQVTWRPVSGVDHYTVNVFDGTKDRSFVVAAGKTALDVPVSGACPRYRVTVTAHDADGNSAKTNAYLVDRLAPGGITGLVTQRSADSAVLEWKAPISTGAAPLSVYRVQVKEMASGKVLIERNSPDPVEKLTGLNPDRVYVAKVTPENKYGSCFTSTIALGNSQPDSPRGLTAVRNPGNPDELQLSWKAPSWTGFGKVARYEVGYQSSAQPRPVWTPVGLATAMTLKLDSQKTWNVWVRVVNDSGRSRLSTVYKVQRQGAALTPELDPRVDMSESDGIVNVRFTGPVGSSATYPRMNVAIAPTLGGRGFRDSHTVSNGAGEVEFDRVPCGVYSVVVTGLGATGTKEFGRKVVNRCDTGQVPANLWKLVYGKADVAGNSVAMKYGNEARVISTTKRTSEDMVFTTSATLRSGWGYGIWTRASMSGGAAASGYSFQYDPGYANVNASFGKALLLRVWDKGSECGTPIAKVKWPAGVAVNDPHDIVVVAQGDSLYASIDGTVVRRPESQAGARRPSRCNVPEPHGPRSASAPELQRLGDLRGHDPELTERVGPAADRRGPHVVARCAGAAMRFDGSRWTPPRRG
ncbi:MAG: fibronectin type III domain-containing protein [Candidatus Nanopelagicales bacterium]